MRTDTYLKNRRENLGDAEKGRLCVGDAKLPTTR